MKTLDSYRGLPDVMSSAEVAAEFEEILDDPDCAHLPHDTVAILSELSERQWNTYTLLDNGVRGEVERLLEKLWRDDDADLAESLFGVAGRLGLPPFLSFVRSGRSSDPAFFRRMFTMNREWSYGAMDIAVTTSCSCSAAVVGSEPHPANPDHISMFRLAQHSVRSSLGLTGSRAGN